MTAERRRYWRPEASLDLVPVSIARGGKLTAVAAGLGTGLFILVVQICIDRLLGQLQLTLLYSDIFMACVTGVATGIGLRHYQTHMRADQARNRMVAEMNHHVRNALTIISLSVHSKNDPQLETTTYEAIQRIDWALREVLGPEDPISTIQRKPLQAQAAAASRRSA